MTASASVKQPPIYKMEPAVEKVIESILFLITRGEEKKSSVTQYDIVKSLFLADKAHLNKFGRPITFDNYVAMKNGPVPSFAYSVLKHECSPAVFDYTKEPWEREIGKYPTSPGAMYFVSPKRRYSEDILSRSDIDALESALSTAQGLTFGQLRKLTHDDAAYVAAWGDGESANPPMSLGLLFDTPDYEEAEHVQFASQHR